jgi:hypothetical protein
MELYWNISLRTNIRRIVWDLMNETFEMTFSFANSFRIITPL